MSPDGILGDYPYFSSYSDSWLRHAERYVAQITERFRLGPTHRVVELGSNDGYVLQYVVARGIPALGIEPAANVRRPSGAASPPGSPSSGSRSPASSVTRGSRPIW